MKLKKLVMAGFKSFADRTELEFDDGISCIVGPNGCGKSNVVDAMKWVLGEQSAKSLRGSEMLDVIFNGSSARRAAGHARVTLVFDNSDGTLKPVNDNGNGAVSITRKLFRDGQSEYLINKQPCRLRDVREMFMDTGVGKDAYSVIEQGRVEWFLQANRDDRRAVLDEAAGISKYKARKQEAVRKLFRAEQDMLRANDVLGEVARRLRSIKYQAGKARSYQSHSEKLRELRLLYFLAQYHDLSARRAQLQNELDAGNDTLAGIQTKIDQLETARSATEAEAVDLERTARQVQGRIAAIDARITSCGERAGMLAQKITELGEQIVTTSARCEKTEAKINASAREIVLREKDLRQLETRADEWTAQHEAACEEHAAAELAITHLRTRLADEKAGTIDLLRRTAQLHNEIQTSRVHRDNLRGRKQRLADRGEQTDRALQETLTERCRVQVKARDVRDVLRAAQARLDQTRLGSRKLTDNEHALRANLADAREQRSAVQSRIRALCEMQERLEGVGAGVRRVLAAVQEGRLDAIKGMLGDFLQADAQHAPVVEAALAGADQRLLAASFEQLQAQRDELGDVLGPGGTVEVTCLDRIAPFADDFDSARCPRIIGRAIDRVRFPAWAARAVWQVLGKTMIVASLADAAAAARRSPADTRFVTLTGEVLEADGRIRIGAANQAAGVVTRRSELAALHDEHRRLDRKIEELHKQCRDAREEMKHLEKLQQDLRTAVYEANTERVEGDSRLARLDEQLESLKLEQPLIAEDLRNLAAEIEAAVRREHEAREKADELKALNEQREA